MGDAKFDSQLVARLSANPLEVQSLQKEDRVLGLEKWFWESHSCTKSTYMLLTVSRAVSLRPAAWLRCRMIMVLIDWATNKIAKAIDARHYETAQSSPAHCSFKTKRGRRARMGLSSRKRWRSSATRAAWCNARLDSSPGPSRRSFPARWEVRYYACVMGQALIGHLAPIPAGFDLNTGCKVKSS